MILEYTKMKVLNLTNSLRTNPEEAIHNGQDLTDVANEIKTAPEQKALLSQPNSDQYPSNQELSDADINNSSQSTKNNQ